MFHITAGVFEALAFSLRALHGALLPPLYVPRHEFHGWVGLDEPGGEQPAPAAQSQAIQEHLQAIQERERRLEAREKELERLFAELERQKGPRRPRPEPAPAPGQANRPMRVVIYGLKNNQVQEITYEFRRHKTRVDFVFISRDVNTPRFPERVDRVILAVGKISHAWDHAAIEKFGRDRVHRVGGCTTAVKRKIRELLAL